MVCEDCKEEQEYIKEIFDQLTKAIDSLKKDIDNLYWTLEMFKNIG